MKKSLFVLLLLPLLAARAERIQAVTIFGQLVTVESATPLTYIAPPVALTGLVASESILAADGDVVSGELYVFTNAPGAVVPSEYRLRRVDPATGATTQVGPVHALSGVTRVGMDFYPLPGGGGFLRICANNGLNFVLNRTTGARNSYQNLSFAPADPFAGVSPAVSAMAVDSNPITYGADAASGHLVRWDEASFFDSGVLVSIGPLGLDLTNKTVCFDISAASGTAYLSVGDNGAFFTRLYTVNLATGAATLVGEMGSNMIFRGMSVLAPGGPTPVDFTWAGGTGVTSDPANWDPAQLPTSIDTVRILSGSPQVDATLDAASLINDQAVTFTNGDWNIHASLTNDGTLFLNDRSITLHGNIPLHGNGNLRMAGGIVTGRDPETDYLFNIGNQILGHGAIQGLYVNQSNAVVRADDGVLYIDRPVSNQGLLQAAANATLSLSGDQPFTLDNTGGLIRANYEGSVYLGGPISGGHIENNLNPPGVLTGAIALHPEQIRSPPTAGVFFGSNSGFSVDAEVSSDEETTTLEGLDVNGNPAEFTLLSGRDLVLRGFLNNNGVIRAYGNPEDLTTRIQVAGPTILVGTGAIELGWGGRDRDEITGGSNLLTLLYGPRLSGGGIVSTRVSNQNSTILADRFSATEGTYPLRFTQPVENHGLMRAENNGALDIQASSLVQWSAFVPVTGRVENASGGAVTFTGTEIIGGALNQTAGEPSFQYHHATLDGETAPGIELRGTHRAGGSPSDTLDIKGYIHFVGGAVLEIVGTAELQTRGFPELTGIGRVHLGADATAGYIRIPDGDTVHNAISIAGVGSIRGGGVLWNRPEALLHAFDGTLSTHDLTLYNEGLLWAGGHPSLGQGHVAGRLQLGGTIHNSGTVRVNNDLSSLSLLGGTIIGGTIETRGSNSASVEIYGWMENLALVNDMRVKGGTWCDLAGRIEFLPGLFPDSYLLVGGDSGETTVLGINGGVTLEGSGGIWLQDPGVNSGLVRLVEGDANPNTGESIVLRNGARLRGAGFVEVDVYNDSGAILADTAGNRLVFAPGRLRPLSVNLPGHAPAQVADNPGLLLPNLALGVVQVANGATVEIQQARLSGMQLHASGAGKIVLSGATPLLANLHAYLDGASELISTSLLTVGHGASLALVGSQAPALPASAGCDIPNLVAPVGPKMRIAGLIANDGGTLVANDGGTLIANDGGTLVANDGGTLIANDGGTLVANDGGTLIANDGGTLIANDGGTLIGMDGASLVANDGGTLKTVGGNIVAQGGGNIVASGGGNIVAQGGGNLANRATGSMVAGGGLNGLPGAPPAYGALRIENQGSLSANDSRIRLEGGNRDTVMADNQAGGRVDLNNRTCMKVPAGRFKNSGTLRASQSNLVTGFFQNVGNTVVSGVSWAWNGAVGAVTGVVNGVGGVINATGSFFGRLFGGAALAEGGEGFALAGMSVADPSDFINEGTFILGDGITTNTVDMGFTQTNTGMLCVQLGGTATNGYDRLFINGPSVLGGVLQLVFTNNFAPTLGDTFDFLVCPDVIGNFDTVEVLGLPADANWQYHAVFTNGAYRVVSDSTVVLPIGAFRALHGLTADGSQDYANPSGDRIGNLFKFAFNLAPNAGDLNTANYKVLASASDTSGLPRLIPNLDGSFTYVYVRRKASTAPGISYHPEIDTSLGGAWTALVPTREAVDSIDATWERVRLTLGSPLPAPYTSGAFLKVLVER